MTDVLTTLSKLPPVAYLRDATDPRRIIAVKRGVIGFYPVRLHPRKRRAPSDFNPADITPQQLYAMSMGSCFGWEVPAADPDRYTEQEARELLASADRDAEEMFKRYGDVEPPRDPGQAPEGPNMCMWKCGRVALDAVDVCAECSAVMDKWNEARRT